MTYGNMGCVYEKLGKFEKALEMHQKDLEIKLQAVGQHHAVSGPGWRRSVHDGPVPASELKIEMQKFSRRVICLGALSVCIACVVCLIKYDGAVVTTDTELSENECISSLENMARALDFESIDDYETQMISSGQKLPCGLKMKSTSLKSGQRSIVNKQDSFWSMILGNLFDSPTSHNIRSTDSRGGQTSLSRKPSSTPRAKVKINFNEEKNLEKSREYRTMKIRNASKESAAGRSLGELQSVNIKNKKNTIEYDQVKRAIKVRPLLNERVAGNSSGEFRAVKVMVRSLDQISRNRSEVGLKAKVQKNNGSATIDRFRSVSIDQTDHGQPDLLSTSGKHAVTSMRSVPSVGGDGSGEWFAKLKAEAHRLGYALVRSKARKVGSGPVRVAGQEIFKSSQNASNQPSVSDIRQNDVNLQIETNTSNDLHENTEILRPMDTEDKTNTNSFVLKESDRLQNQARIEAAMHAHLKSEARYSMEHFHDDAISKEVQVIQCFLLPRAILTNPTQAQAAALDAIKRYSHVLSFDDSVREADEARFQKLSFDAKRTDQGGDTIRKKVNWLTKCSKLSMSYSMTVDRRSLDPKNFVDKQERKETNNWQRTHFFNFPMMAFTRRLFPKLIAWIRMGNKLYIRSIKQRIPTLLHAQRNIQRSQATDRNSKVALYGFNGMAKASLDSGFREPKRPFILQLNQLSPMVTQTAMCSLKIEEKRVVVPTEDFRGVGRR